MRGVAVVALAVVTLGACSSKDGATSATTTPAAVTTTTLGGPEAYVDRGDYSFGRHVGKITAVAPETHKITVDFVQFLTGDAAVKAYQEDTHTTETPDNDYYVRNASTQLRTLSLYDDIDIRVNISGGFEPSSPGEGHQVRWETFASYWQGDGNPAKYSLFWISLEGGIATAIAEQYVP